MRSALLSYAVDHQLVVDGALSAWLHHSENIPSSSAIGRLLGRRANPADPDAEHDVLVVLHPTHVMVVVAGAIRGTSVFGVPLAAASISDHPRTTLAGNAFGEADGFTLTGLSGDEGRPGSFYIGVGPEPAGDDCAQAVRTAVARAKNPAWADRPRSTESP